MFVVAVEGPVQWLLLGDCSQSPVWLWTMDELRCLFERKLFASFFDSHMGISKNTGTPKWMVKIMENPYEQMDDLGGKTTPIFGLTSILRSRLIHCCRSKHLNDSWRLVFFTSFLQFLVSPWPRERRTNEAFVLDHRSFVIQNITMIHNDPHL